MPTLGWDRAYRSGDLVVNDADGAAVRRPRRRPGQDRRPPDRARRDRQRPARAPRAWSGAAAAVRRTAAGNQLLVGYVTVDERFDAAAALATLRGEHAGRDGAAAGRRSTTSRPAPRARSTATRCRGRCPAPTSRRGRGLEGTAAWIAGLWLEVLGATVRTPRRRLLRPRRRQPDRRPDGLAAARAATPTSPSATSTTTRRWAGWPTTSTSLGRRRRHAPSDAVRPTPLKTQAGQVVAVTLLRAAGRAPLAGLAAGRAPTWCAAVYDVAWLADRAVVVVAGRLAGVHHAARPDAAGRRRRPAAAARAHARRAPARRQDPPAAVGGRAAGRPARRDQPGRCAVDDLVRPAARRPGRPARRPALACRR